MGFLKDEFGIEENLGMKESTIEYNHSVFIHFVNGSQENEELYTVGMRLSKFIEEHRLGVYDFHEVAMDGTHGTLFMYGNDAEKLFKGVLPILKIPAFLKGATAVLRFGSYKDQEDKEIEVELDNA